MTHAVVSSPKQINRFASALVLALGLCVGCVAPTDLPEGSDTAAISGGVTDPTTGEVITHSGLCNEGRFRCLARLVARDGITAQVAPTGFGPADLQSLYTIDPNLGDGVTIAVVDSYGYSALESDLAAYRKQFGLPACTKANGCLRIVNQAGQTSPLPGPMPGGALDWTEETALDVDMVSAACPRCKIIVVQGDVDNDTGALYEAQNAAVALGATAISNSWTGQEYAGEDADDAAYFTHPGVGIFGGTGDWGFNAAQEPSLTGPQFPSTSLHVVAVGGTSAVRSTNSRGWAESVWTSAGSSCSTLVGKPSYQPSDTGCAGRAASDVSAVADPNTALAVYNAAAGGWIEVGGTSAATPIVASLMAAAGHGAVTPGYFYQNPTAFHDVKAGSNGPCATKLCDGAAGWDGPTGMGTPNQSVIAGTSVPVPGGPTVAITSPAANATVDAGFTIKANVGGSVSSVTLAIDGTVIGRLSAAPFQFTAPSSLAAGAHSVAITATNADGFDATSTITVTVTPATTTDPVDPDPGMSMDNGTGGCGAGGGGAGGGLMLMLALSVASRRRR